MALGGAVPSELALSPELTFNASRPPRGSVLLLDRPDCDGTFVVNMLIAASLRAGDNVLVATAQGWEQPRTKAITKLGADAAEVEEQLHTIDLWEAVPPPDEAVGQDRSKLAATAIAQAAANIVGEEPAPAGEGAGARGLRLRHSHRLVLVMDDCEALADLCGAPDDADAVVRSLMMDVSTLWAGMVARCPVLPAPADGAPALHRRLRAAADVLLTVQPLPSGQSTIADGTITGSVQRRRAAKDGVSSMGVGAAPVQVFFQHGDRLRLMVPGQLRI